MHKVCDIRNPDLRAAKDPREAWTSYVRDLERLIDKALDGAPASVVSLRTDAARDAERKAA
jgi:hypothetical protein